MRRTLLVIISVALVALGATPVTAQSLKIECRASHAAADDPIVFPGRPGAAHLHEFFGNQTTNAKDEATDERRHRAGSVHAPPQHA